MPFGISPDVPPEEGAGASFGLTLQFESNGTPLGEADVTTVNFGSGVVVTRGLSGDPNKIDVTVPGGGGGGGGGGGDADAIPGVISDGTTDNFAVMSAAVGPTGTYVASTKGRAKFATTGPVLINGLLDVDASISVPNDGRGITVLVPGDNLPATTGPIAGETPPSGVGDGSGAPAAFVRIPRSTPNSAHNLAFSYTWRGLNLDARGTTQVNPVHGIRIPNADPSKNPNDPDPHFTGNKDYVAGEFYNMDITGFPGSGFTGESTNGRLHLHSVRGLNNGLHGFDLGGNDIVVSGHSAAGTNGGFGFKIGEAAGFFATTMNVWSSPAQRSLTCGAMWITGRKLFGVGFSEFNDWIRMSDSGSVSGGRGGTISLNSFAPFDTNFVSDGIAIDATGSGPDSKLQAHIGIDDYKAVNFIGNQYQRTPKASFNAWMNVGGNQTGLLGTAHQRFLDLSNNSMANTIDTVNSCPNVRPWTGPQATFTTPVANQLNSVAHGFNADDQIALTTTGSLAAGLPVGITLFVQLISTGGGNFDPDNFKVARTPGGTTLTFSGAGTGTHTWGLLNTLPYDTHGGSQLNFLLMDSFKNEVRIGAMGRTHSKIMLGSDVTDFGTKTGLTGTFTVSGNTATAALHGMSEGAPITLTTSNTLPAPLSTTAQVWAINVSANTFQFASLPGGDVIHLTDTGTGTHTFWSWKRVYQIEVGDKTQPGGKKYRNAMRGMWEFDNALQYTDLGYDTRATTDGGTRTVQAGDAFQLFSTTGGGIASFNVVLPTELDATFEFVTNFAGGPIAALTFTTAPTGGQINTNAFHPPTSSPGAMNVRWLYRRDTNTWYVTQVSGGAYSAPMGRVSGSGVEAGVVGETQRDFQPVGSAVSLTTATPTTVHSLVVTPGRYMLTATFGFNAASATGVTNTQWALNTTTNAFPAVKDESYGARQFASASVNAIFSTETVCKLVSITTPTTYYAVQQADFSGGACSGYGTIIALRIG